MYDVFFIESMSNGTKHGIGSYAKNLLPLLITTKKDNLNLYYVKIQFTSKAGVTIRKKSKNFTEVEVYFYEPTLQLSRKEEVNIPPIVVRQLLCILSDYFIKNRVTVFHINSVLHYSFTNILKEYDFKTVYTQHVALWTVFYNNDIDKFETDWNKKDRSSSIFLKSIEAEKQIFNNVDQIICLTEASKQFAKKYFIIPEKKISLIPNGISPKEYASENIQYKQLFKRRYGFKETDFIFLFVGRLTPQKGINALIHSFTKLVDKYALDFKLLIVGGGNIEEYISITSSICGRVSFTGYLEPEKTKQLYQIADVGILPSSTEQSSFVALEMLANKLPLIVSDINAFDYPFEHLKNVIKIKTTKSGSVDIDDLAKWLLTLYETPELRSQLSEQGYDLLEQKFTSYHMAEKTLSVYESIQ